MTDFSGLISQLFSTYWWLLPLLLIIATLFKSAWFKGFIGEVMPRLSVRDKQFNNSCLASAYIGVLKHGNS